MLSAIATSSAIADPYDPSAFAFGDPCATRTDDDCAVEACPTVDHCRWSWDPKDPQKWSGDTARCRCDVAPSKSEESTSYAFDIMAAPDFVAGFMYGMTGYNHLEEIEACYTGGQ